MKRRFQLLLESLGAIVLEGLNLETRPSPKRLVKRRAYYAYCLRHSRDVSKNAILTSEKHAIDKARIRSIVSPEGCFGKSGRVEIISRSLEVKWKPFYLLSSLNLSIQLVRRLDQGSFVHPQPFPFAKTLIGLVDETNRVGRGIGEKIGLLQCLS